MIYIDIFKIMLHLSSNINDSSHWNIDIQLNILTQSIKSLKEHGKHSDIFTDTKYKYKYKYFIGRNTITIIGKGSKWSYSSCLWIENTILWHYYEYWIISFLRIRQLLM